MGYFSYLCKLCNHSIASSDCRGPLVHLDGGRLRRHWLMECVLLERDGAVILGTYDGYGRIEAGDATLEVGSSPILLHQACWRTMGSPDQSKFVAHAWRMPIISEDGKYRMRLEPA